MTAHKQQNSLYNWNSVSWKGHLTQCVTKKAANFLLNKNLTLKEKMKLQVQHQPTSWKHFTKLFTRTFCTNLSSVFTQCLCITQLDPSKANSPVSKPTREDARQTCQNKHPEKMCHPQNLNKHQPQHNSQNATASPYKVNGITGPKTSYELCMRIKLYLSPAH